MESSDESCDSYGDTERNLRKDQPRRHGGTERNEQRAGTSGRDQPRRHGGTERNAQKRRVSGWDQPRRHGGTERNLKNANPSAFRSSFALRSLMTSSFLHPSSLISRLSSLVSPLPSSPCLRASVVSFSSPLRASVVSSVSFFRLLPSSVVSILECRPSTRRALSPRSRRSCGRTPPVSLRTQGRPRCAIG